MVKRAIYLHYESNNQSHAPPRIPTTTDLLADTIIVLWFAIYKNDINTMEFGFWNMSLPITVNIFNGSNDLFSSVLLMYLDVFRPAVRRKLFGPRPIIFH